MCVAAAHHVSCEMHKQYSNIEGMELAIIDPDGSGPLPPFDVGCDRGQQTSQLTFIACGREGGGDYRLGIDR